MRNASTISSARSALALHAAGCSPPRPGTPGGCRLHSYRCGWGGQAQAQAPAQTKEANVDHAVYAASVADMPDRSEDLWVHVRQCRGMLPGHVVWRPGVNAGSRLTTRLSA
jgi:hypothetical protein